MKQRRHVYCWVIRADKKGHDMWGNPAVVYFIRRTGLKNPHYLQAWHPNVKRFASKEAALDYYMAKANKIAKIASCTVIRKKIFLDGKGYYDWSKNGRSFQLYSRRES